MVAGMGFEPHDLRVMSPTSYQTALLRDMILCAPLFVCLYIISHFLPFVKPFFRFILCFLFYSFVFCIITLIFHFFCYVILLDFGIICVLHIYYITLFPDLFLRLRFCCIWAVFLLHPCLCRTFSLYLLLSEKELSSIITFFITISVT